jgi:predicted RND superfamily exporter protein
MVRRFWVRARGGDRGLFGLLAAWILRRPFAWSAALIVAAALGALLSSRMTVSSDMLGLLPQDEPSLVALRQLDSQEGGTNLLTLTIDGATQDEVDAFADEVGGRLERLATVRSVLWKAPPELTAKLGPLQLPPEDLRNLRDRLKGALALGPAAANPFIAQKLYAMGPLAEKLSQPAAKFSLTSRPNSARIIVRPTGSSHDLPFARRLMREVDEAIAAANPEAHHVTIPWVGGPYRHAIEDVDGISHDIGWTAIPTFLLVSLAIAFAYRDWKPVVIIMVPQLIGSAWTLGFAKIAIGSVNMFTSFALAVLVGLGNDYGIVLFSRYREERATGLSTDEAIIRAWSKAGGPAFTAALTAAAGFIALLAASFKGFQQLGMIIGAGVPLCFLAVVFVVPLLIRALEPKQTAMLASTATSPEGGTGGPSYRIGFPIVTIAVVCAILGAIALPTLRFDDDLSHLRRKGMSYGELTPDQQALARDGYSPVIISYPDEASLNHDWALVQTALTEDRLPKVSRALSIRSILPADAASRAPLVAEIASLARDPNARYLPPPIRQALAPLANAAPNEDFLVGPEDFPESIQGLLGAGPGKHRILLLPNGNQWSMHENAELADQLETLLPGRTIAGEFVAMAILYRMLTADAPRILIAAAFLVSLLIYLDLRSLPRVALVMGVQTIGMLWAVGMRVLLDMPINLVNFIGIPICMGTGIQAGIFLSHRLHEEGRGGIRRALLTTGLASSLCTITTLLAFASLILADSRGIRSLGTGILAADLTVALSGFILLPASYAVVYALWPAPNESNDHLRH